MLPTDIQQRAVRPMLLGADVFIRAQTGSGKTLAFLLPLLSMLTYPPLMYPEDLPGPQAVIIVPHRELGVQACLLAFRLLGGAAGAAGGPGARGNMFSYAGPRGVRVRGCLDKEEVLRAKTAGYLRGCHVVVATPPCLAECLAEPEPCPLVQHTKVLVVDEADECMRGYPREMEAVLSAAVAARPDGERPTLAFAGATLEDALCAELADAGWARYAVRVGATALATVPPGLRHRFAVRPAGASPASLLAKLLRADQRGAPPDAPPPRGMVFAQDAEAAEALATPLRAALWEEHRIGLVLPDGSQPTQTLHEFRDNATSVILVTPQHARGLDLPAVTHVYILGAPASAVAYVHFAGRAGRLGQTASGTVTTVLDAAEVPQLRAAASAAGVALEEVDAAAVLSAAWGPAQGGDPLDGARKGLEDTYHLY